MFNIGSLRIPYTRSSVSVSRWQAGLGESARIQLLFGSLYFDGTQHEARTCRNSL